MHKHPPAAPSSVGHEEWHRALLQERLRNTTEHHLADPAMGEGAHNNQVGPEQSGLTAQGLRYIALFGHEVLDRGIHAVAREVWGNLRPRQAVSEISCVWVGRLILFRPWLG